MFLFITVDPASFSWCWHMIISPEYHCCYMAVIQDSVNLHTLIENWKISSKWGFIAYMSLSMSTETFRLRRNFSLTVVVTPSVSGIAKMFAVVCLYSSHSLRYFFYRVAFAVDCIEWKCWFHCSDIFDAMFPMHRHTGEVIIQQGEPHWNITFSMQISVCRAANDICILLHGIIFGLITLIVNMPMDF